MTTPKLIAGHVRMNPIRASVLLLAAFIATVCFFVSTSEDEPEQPTSTRQLSDNQPVASSSSPNAGLVSTSSVAPAATDSGIGNLLRAVPELSRHILSRVGNVELAATGESGRALLFKPHASPGNQIVRVELPEKRDSARSPIHLMAANRIVVHPAPNTSESEGLALARKLNGQVVGRDKLTDAFLIEFPGYEDLSTLPRLVSSLPSEESWIAFAEPDFLYRMARVPNDPDYSRQKAMDSQSTAPGNIHSAINASAGWDTRTSAASQIVAVIDTGIQLANPDLKNNLWSNRLEKVDGIDNDGNGYIDDIHGINLIDKNQLPDDTDGHGTAVAGLIGASGNNRYAIAGVAWQVQLMPIRIFGEDGFAASSDAATAILYAVNHGAKIINASWGGESDSLLLKRAIERANDAGALFVASAGNESQDIEYAPTYPASYQIPNILTVAATTLYGNLASFSNSNESLVHIAAPGENLISLSIKPGQTTALFSGTSFSAPLVSGIAALAREQFGPESPEALKRRILVSARVYEERVIPQTLSRGHADLDRVLREIKSSPKNDDRENAIELTPLNDRHSGNTSLAGTQKNEPLPDSSSAWGTVWYSAKPDTDSPFRIRVSDQGPDTVISFFAGDELTPIEATVLEDSDYMARFELSAESEETIYIQIAAKRLIWFQIALETIPQNDNFAQSIPISLEPFAVSANSLYATSENDEPSYNGEGSVWWTYLAQEDGQLQLSTAGSDFDSLLHVYTGQALSSLRTIAFNDDVDLSATHSELVIDVQKGGSYHIRVSGKGSHPHHAKLSGRLLRKPLFVELPSDTTLPIGAQASFRGRALGPRPITYQWYFKGTPIPGADSPLLIIEAIDESDVGEYTLVATSPAGKTSSPPARLALLGQAPEFALQPRSGDFPQSSDITLAAFLKNPSGASYQWYKDDAPITGANANSFLIENAEASDSATYHLVATNPNGSIQSASAIITVGDEQDFLWRPIFDDDSVRDIVGIVQIHGQATWFAAAYDRLWQSTDGFSWEEANIQIDGQPTGPGEFASVRKVMYGNGKYIVAFDSVWAVGASLEKLVMVKSPDTRNRVRAYNGAFLNGYFYAWQNQSQQLSRSLDGVIWENLPARIFRPKDIIANPAQSAFGVIQSDAFHFSTDMENWAEYALPYVTAWNTPLLHDGTRFVVALGGGRIYSTPNGKSWTQHTPLPEGEGSIMSSAYSKGKYIMLRSDGLFVSSDLQTWDFTPFEAYNIETLYAQDGILIGDGISINPARLLNSTQTDFAPPIILPQRMSPYYRLSPGTRLTLSVEVQRTIAPIDRVEFLHNGQPFATLTQSPYATTWRAEKKGTQSIEAVVYDSEGRASRTASTITVIAPQTALDPSQGVPSGAYELVEAFGSMFASGGEPFLYRLNNDNSWIPHKSFSESAIRKVFAFHDSLYVFAGPHLYRTTDGDNWELTLSHIEDSEIHLTNTWLIVSRRDDSLEAWFTSDGESWIRSQTENHFIYGALNDTLVCKVNLSNKIGLLAPGQKLRLANLPPNANVQDTCTDGLWFYIGYNSRNEDYQYQISRTRDFNTWESIASIDGNYLDYANNLFTLAGGKLSSDLQNWIELGFSFSDALKTEDAYLLAVNGDILRSVNGVQWDTVLEGHVDRLMETSHGFFAWTNDYSQSGQGIYHSLDGIQWATLQETPVVAWEPYTDIAFGNDRYVAAGEKQAISFDGRAWTPLDKSIGLGESVAFGNDRFLASTKGQTHLSVASSEDGRSWTIHKVNETENSRPILTYLEKANAFFLYDDQAKTLLKSKTGQSWSTVTNRPIYNAYLIDNYIAIHYEDDFSTQFTIDGTTWRKTDRIAQSFAHGYYYSQNYVSANGANWELIESFQLHSDSGPKIPLRDGSLLIKSASEIDGLNLLYKTRNGKFEKWVLADINDYGFGHFYLNGINFLLGNEIRQITTDDLFLKQIKLSSPAIEAKVGDTLPLRLEIENQGLVDIDLDGMLLESRLIQTENGFQSEGFTLASEPLPQTALPVGETKFLDLEIEIPPGVHPGAYHLSALLNPQQTIPEYSIDNNYARDDDSLITLPQGSLSITVIGNGDVAITPDRNQYAIGDTIILTALPHPKHRLKSATGPTIERQNLYAATIEAQTSVTFEFEEALYTISITGSPHGTIEVDPLKETYLEGEYVTVKATPHPNHTFIRWRTGLDSPEQEQTFAIRSNIELSALFGQSYAQWTQTSFTEEQRADESTIATSADPDHDNINNLWEYLTGQDPNSTSLIKPIEWSLSEETLTINFRYSILASDYTVQLQTTEDGKAWIKPTGAIIFSDLSATEVVGQLSIPISEHDHLLVRLAATPEELNEP
ncbi:S8 family serine peptidase [Pelagicoccus sp. SDUM812003]|uniref:S8 family serine peptidase n=1 Tax=Pelagicoccus sp. SDUM812003 TaxID=3041267 RepID=UPI00280C7B32|nr:S8 family serine peptidase [Pelagicoccus sp. SDUM812003]MDQ8205655.1 S8 family serine peptidase [Pelagicoccus sp. SDUM812003]